MDYLKYTVEDFIADESFQRYCLKTNDRDMHFWAQWRKEHPEMQDKVEEAEQFIASLEALHQKPHDILYYRRKQAIRDNLRHTLASSASTEVSSLRPWQFAAAAVFLLGCVIAAFLYTQNHDDTAQHPVAIQYIEKSNPAGTRSKFRLPDGSTVYLNANSKLRYAANFTTLGTRNIILSGEAFFEVRKDPAKPFIVYSKHLRTTAVGTSFTVRAYAGQPEAIALNTGEVSVAGHADSASIKKIRLLPGQGAMLSATTNRLATFEFDSKEFMAWKDGTLYFNNAGEAEVYDKIKNWYGVTIVQKNAAHKKWAFTGEFHQKKLRDVLESISFVMDFSYQIQGDTVAIHYLKK